LIHFEASEVLLQPDEETPEDRLQADTTLGEAILDSGPEWKARWVTGFLE
jgi:hypothetical protein